MKTIFFLISLIIFSTSCSQKRVQILTEIEKEKMIQDINSTMDSMLSACNKLDAKSAFKYLNNSPEYKAVEADGSIFDWESDYKASENFFSQCTNSKIQPILKENLILSNDLAINIMTFNGEATLKTNEKIVWEKITATSIVKRIGNRWTIIHWHASSLPPMISATDPK